ncbi:Protein transport protein Sec16B [Liparis tanakae]|uniref:Protein transport protein Sec16B n=1 Tax=Liparis tanakae TaxID=230148 RepID=A0A4Z2GB02_9TELE|nr:Protein transport protein Sec16B [Liparis tanakae]
MSSGLWGHALFLASKMDNRSYTTVLNRFTGQLTASDPLQTLFHLLTGRIPAVSMCCGDEKWGDWRPHLAVMLSNETGDPAVQQKAIVTMGDTLASRGLVHAAHLCYLTAGVAFGGFNQKAERLVLLGSSHSRLLDCGLASQAFHYCEVVGRAILRERESSFVLTGEVIKLSDRLRHAEGEFSDAGVSGAGQEPDWLRQLRARHHGLQTGSYTCPETFQSPPEGSALAQEDDNVSLESRVDDLNRDIQSPEPELLYYTGVGEQANLQHQVERLTEELNVLSWGDNGAQGGPHANSPMPVPLVYAPPAPTGTESQAFGYHNRDSAEVIDASPHCPPAAEGAGSSYGAGPMGLQMLDVNVSRQGQFQQSVGQGLGGYEQTGEPPQQSTKAGWFSGWFKSKPKDVHEDSSEQRSPAQMELPPTSGFCPPPPPAMFSSQPSSAGINPFSRKAGQQLG